MNMHLINLLPHTKRAAYGREYVYRLLTIVCVALSCVLVASAVLMVPTYMYAHERVVKEQETLATLEHASNSTEEQQVAVRIQKLSASTKYLERLTTTPRVAAFIAALLAVPHPGIAITSIAVTPPGATSQTGTSVVSGVASTREALRAYSLALGDLHGVANVDLPIGVYAREAQIPFSLTLTSTFTP